MKRGRKISLDGAGDSVFKEKRRGKRGSEEAGLGGVKVIVQEDGVFRRTRKVRMSA